MIVTRKTIQRFLIYLLLLCALLLPYSLTGCTPETPKPCGGDCPTGFSCIDGKNCIKDCEQGKILCGSTCADTKTNAKHCGKCGVLCKSGEICKNAKCTIGATCNKGKTPCGTTCADLNIDTNHCGACDNKCKDGESCQSSTCKPAPKCAGDETICGETCVKLQKDTKHCGLCGKACKSEEECKAGKCEPKCTSPQIDCGGSCTDIKQSNEHCGACNNKCQNGQICDLGVCACPRGKPLCDGACVDTSQSKQNCGSCGNACNTKEQCQKGICALQCEDGKTACNGACVDTKTDIKHCGACASPCGSGLICNEGSCQCPMGTIRCDGACVNAQTNAKHCGVCGTACKSTEVCDSGTCKSTCSQGKTGCGTSCVDLQNDKDHCGACGNQCRNGRVCCAGACVDTSSSTTHCGTCGTACKTGDACCSGSCKTLNGSDVKNCGNCGVSCGTAQICDKGSCSCKNTCNGTCVDFQIDKAHCGKCGRVCGSLENCIAGECEIPCPLGQSKCRSTTGKPRTCHDLQRDPDHCGACGSKCKAGKACNNGTCVAACTNQEQLCSRFCINTNTDSSHCGGCGKTCSLGKRCINGSCSCPSTREVCENGKDDDCDGKIDNGCALVTGIGSPNREGGRQIYGDANGNIYVAAIIHGNITLAGKQIAVSSPSMLIVKMDRYGKVLWANSAKSNQPTSVAPFGTMQIFGITADKNGNVFVTGSFIATLILTPTIRATARRSTSNISAYDIFVAKLTPNGQWSWIATGGITNTIKTVSYTTIQVVADSKGNAIITGYMENGLTPFTLTPGNIQASSRLTTSQPFVAKINSSGTWQWIAHGITTRFSYRSQIVIDSKDHVYIYAALPPSGGEFGLFRPKSAGDYDAYIAKIDPNGKYVWFKTIATSGSDSMGFLGINTKDEVFVAGAGRGQSIKFGPNITITPGTYVAKIDANGTWKWARNIPVPFTIGHMGADTQDNTYFCHDGRFIKRDPTGKVLFNKHFGANWWNTSSSCYISLSNHVHMTGSFDKNIIIDGKGAVHKGNKDIMVIRSR